MPTRSFGSGSLKAMVGLSGAAGRTALQFSVLNWSAWSTERETRAAWRAWATGGVEVIDEIATPALPMLLQRRLSPMGQRVVGAISACTVGLPPARYILATRHGELSRALATLDGMREDGVALAHGFQHVDPPRTARRDVDPERQQVGPHRFVGGSRQFHERPARSRGLHRGEPR